MNAGRRNNRIVDRVAVTAIFAVAILILTMSALTLKPAQLPMPAAVTMALSSSLSLPVSNKVEPTAKAPKNAWSH